MATDEATLLSYLIEARGFQRGAGAILELATRAANFLAEEHPHTAENERTVKAVRALVESGQEMVGQLTPDDEKQSNGDSSDPRR